MGVRFSNLQGLSEFRPDSGRKNVAGPDVKVTIGDDFGTRRIGIELTLYSSDAGKKKGSVVLRRDSVRRHLRKELEGFLGEYPELDRFQIIVRFRRGEEDLRARDCRQIAADIARLMGPTLSRVRRCRSFDAILRPKVFIAYSGLQKHVGRIDIYRNTANYRGTFGWFNQSTYDTLGIER